MTDETPAAGWATVGAVPMGTVLKDSIGHIYLRTGDALICISNLNLTYPADSGIVSGMRAVNATFTVTSWA